MKKSFPAQLERLYDMLEFIRDHTKAVGCDSNFVNKVELASEEVLVNIISYGYPARDGVIEIYWDFSQENAIKITIVDSGVPYNPLRDRKTFDSQLALQEKTVGGYGVFFIMNLMDEVNYQREEDLNILTLVKYK